MRLEERFSPMQLAGLGLSGSFVLFAMALLWSLILRRIHVMRVENGAWVLTTLLFTAPLIAGV